jgi:multidrug resistance efflux pump
MHDLESSGRFGRRTIMNTFTTVRLNGLSETASRPRAALVAALALMLIACAVGSSQCQRTNVAASSGVVTIVASDAETTVRAVRVTVGERVKAGDVLVELEPTQSTEPSAAVVEAMARLARADEELSYADGADVSARVASLSAANEQLAKARLSQLSTVVRAPVAGVVEHVVRGVGEEAPSKQPLVELLSASEGGEVTP